MADTFWHLRFQADPFVRSYVRSEIPVGLTLAEAVAGLEIAPEAVELFFGGQHVPREKWARIKPKAFMQVDARAVPGAAAAIPLIGAIGGSYVTSALVSIGIGQTLASIAGLAVTFAVQALASSLFAPQSKSLESEKSKPTYSISGARNELRPWGAIPIVLGRHRYTPPYAAAPITMVFTGKQYLHMLVTWGYGPVSLSDIRIGNTPISKFKDVQIEHDLDGTATHMSLYPTQAEQLDVGVDLTTSWIERNTDTETDHAYCSIAFLQGLYRIDGDGDRRTSHAGIRAEYRPAAGGTWVPFHDKVYADKTTSALYDSFWVTFPSRGQWSVRMIRDTDETDTDTQETVTWLNMKSVRSDEPVFAPGIAKTAIRIKATDQLNGVIDTLNAIVSRKVPTWWGTGWSTGAFASSNPAAIYRDILRGAANARATTATKDDALGAWYDFCVANSLTYDKPIETQTSLMDVLTEVAAAGMASPHLDGDEWSVVIDKAKSGVVQHFTPRNTWDFSGSIAYPEQPHCLRVQFTNASRDWEADEILVYDDGYSAANATRFEVLRPAGVTTFNQAYKFGRFFLAAGRLRPERWSFSVDFEHLVAQRGDLVRLTHDVPLIGQASARIKSVAGTTVTVDDYFTWESGKTYYIRARKSDGSTHVTLATAAVGSTKSFAVSDAAGLAAGDLVMFGESGQASELCIVDRITHGEDLSARIECIPYREDVYNSWSTIPDYTSVLSLPVSLALKGPARPEVVSVVSDESALPVDLQGVPVPTILVRARPGDQDFMSGKATPTTGIRIGWKLSSKEQYTHQTFSAETEVFRIAPVEAGESYDLSVQAVDANGATSEAVTVNGHVVVGLDGRPPAVDTFRAANRGDGSYVEWTYPSIVADVVGYEIRWHPDQDVTSWQRMTPLATDVPRSARSFMVPSVVGSYAIKAVDFLGNRSETALYVNAGITDPRDTNVVVSLYEDSGFAGAMSGVAEISGALQLVSDDPISTWTLLSDVTAMAGTPVTEGTYEFGAAQDLGAVYTVRCSWEADVSNVDFRSTMDTWETLASLDTLEGDATGDEYSVQMEIAYSRDDVGSSPTWSAWQPFTAGDYTGRWFKFRLVMRTKDTTVVPVVDWLRATIDVPDRIERGDDIASGTSAHTVNFGAAFMEVPSITITAQDLATGDYFVIANKATDSFDITFKNSAGTNVDRTFDWQAIGFGKVAA